MSEGLSMSLDDMIKSQPKRGRGGGKGAGGKGAGRGRGAGRGGGRGGGGLFVQKPQKTIAKSSATLSSMSSAAHQLTKAGGLTTGAKLHVGNLDRGVTSADLEELFGELGEVKSAEVVAGPNGQSKGYALVVYRRKADAQSAINQYNGVPLDGRELKIKLAGGSGGGDASAVRVVAQKPAQRVVVLQGRGGGGGARGRGTTRGRGAGKGRGGGGKGGGGGRGKGKPKSAEDLDAELAAYTAAGDAE